MIQCSQIRTWNDESANVRVCCPGTGCRSSFGVRRPSLHRLGIGIRHGLYGRSFCVVAASDDFVIKHTSARTKLTNSHGQPTGYTQVAQTCSACRFPKNPTCSTLHIGVFYINSCRNGCRLCTGWWWLRKARGVRWRDPGWGHHHPRRGALARQTRERRVERGRGQHRRRHSCDAIAGRA